MNGIIGIAFVIFMVGFVIGLAAFSKSKAMIAYAFFCGIAAVVVAVGVFFAGCAIMLSGSHF